MTILDAKYLGFNGKNFIRTDTNPPQIVKMVSLVHLTDDLVIYKDGKPLRIQDAGFRVGNTKEEFDRDD